ncbi:uncharacterized protein TNCV_1597881 [Trichonephila clavipes]|nr:uncharacterized protein TNCV_1597881 [Trichonephila clavipes]
MDIGQISLHTRFLLVSLPNNDMSVKSPFAIQKALIGICGEPKSVKRLRSRDLLIETTLNSCHGVISEPDLLGTSDSEILEGFSDQGVVAAVAEWYGYRIVACLVTSSNPVPLKIHRVGQRCTLNLSRAETSSRWCGGCASVGHSSTDCTLVPKCVNCTQSHPSDSKLCQKWKLEKQIQEIKTNKNISYFEARKLIVPQLTQTYAQATKPSTISTTTQTDPNITNIICPPLQCLKPIFSKNPMPSTSSSVSTFSTSSSSTQENLLPSPSGIIPTIQSESLLKIPIPTTTTTTSPGNNLNTLVSPLETETRSHTTPGKLHLVSTENLPESVPNTSNSEYSNAAEVQQFVKRKSRNRRKRPKVQKPDIEMKMAPHRSKKAAPTEITTDDENMITYDVEEE